MALLALPGPAFVFRFDGDFTVQGKPIRLSLDRTEDGLEDADHAVRTAGAVWDCSVALSQYFEEQATLGNPLITAQEATFLELGSGTGLAGLSLAAVADPSSTVLVTDVEADQPNLQRHIELNKESLSAKTVAQTLDWLALPTDLPQPSVIFAADVVWVDKLIEPFANALLALMSPSCTAILAYQSRSSRADAHLFGLIDARCKREQVQLQTHPHPPKIEIYLLTLKATT
eukprot:m.45343 g.45343  ORF g.45343 m.45343 type:complete len:230 (-) comp10875_c0_seq1:401-1090(-)